MDKGNYREPLISNGRELNCFALNSAGNCSCLKSTNCINCKFFKTKEQINDEHKKCNARLRALNSDIMYKYHSGVDFEW